MTSSFLFLFEPIQQHPRSLGLVIGLTLGLGLGLKLGLTTIGVSDRVNFRVRVKIRVDRTNLLEFVQIMRLN